MRISGGEVIHHGLVRQSEHTEGNCQSLRTAPKAPNSPGQPKSKSSCLPCFYKVLHFAPFLFPILKSSLRLIFHHAVTSRTYAAADDIWLWLEWAPPLSSLCIGTCLLAPQKRVGMRPSTAGRVTCAPEVPTIPYSGCFLHLHRHPTHSIANISKWPPAGTVVVVELPVKVWVEQHLW